MNYQQLIYSLDENLTITNIKNWTYPQNVDVSKIFNWCQRFNINCLQFGQWNYHFKFDRIKLKPYFVYYMWNLNLLNKDIVAIVWPRKMTSYAQNILEELFKYLKKYDCVTISWLADGVDSLCHKLSIKYKIPTIAVLWWWIGYFLQSSNKYKIQNILNNDWLILSEFKLKQIPTNWTFPQRNRIIAWLSKFVFVPEAWEKSWTLITVNDAIDMNIPVFATSNSYFEANSKWINKLIWQKKVWLVYDFDVLFSQYLSLNWQKNAGSDIFNDDLTDLQIKILKIIQNLNQASFEQIKLNLDINDSELFTQISMLELNWKIYQKIPGFYSLK